MIQNRVMKGRWRALKASRSGPKVSHLFFADDLMLFSEASEDQVACIKVGLNLFCKASGQKVNYNKSLMFVSSNIFEQVASRLSDSMGVPLTKEFGKYFGH